VGVSLEINLKPDSQFPHGYPSSKARKFMLSA